MSLKKILLSKHSKSIENNDNDIRNNNDNNNKVMIKAIVVI